MSTKTVNIYTYNRETHAYQRNPIFKGCFGQEKFMGLSLVVAVSSKYGSIASDGWRILDNSRVRVEAAGRVKTSDLEKISTYLSQFSNLKISTAVSSVELKEDLVTPKKPPTTYILATFERPLTEKELRAVERYEVFRKKEKEAARREAAEKAREYKEAEKLRNLSELDRALLVLKKNGIKIVACSDDKKKSA